MTFVPILNCSVGFGGFCRWAARVAEFEIIELRDGRVSRRVTRVLTTMLVGDEPFVAGVRVQEITGALIELGRDENMRLGFRSSVMGRGEAAPDELKRRIRTAIFYRDAHGLLCAEGDLVLIETEIEAHAERGADRARRPRTDLAETGSRQKLGADMTSIVKSPDVRIGKQKFSRPTSEAAKMPRWKAQLYQFRGAAARRVRKSRENSES